jgi:2-polyprenyl-3-methyl-5-hydroxy-6-metoxy-1,4-benzoquinol methylase
LDVYLQRLRIEAALPWIPSGGHVLDVGCADGALFRLGRSRFSSGVGIDLLDSQAWVEGEYERRTGCFPDVLVDGERFDAVVMLAVVEHVSDGELNRWAQAVPQILSKGGRLIITTPAPMVDHILAAGMRLRLLHGMEVHQHHGFDPGDVPKIFSCSGLSLESWRRFELRLNHLFVFAPTS